MPKIQSAAAAALLTFCLAGGAHAVPQYSFVDIGSLGGSVTHGLAINSAGNIAGYSSIGSYKMYYGFSYDGSMHNVGSFHAVEGSQAYDINDSNVVVGSAKGSDGLSDRAFRYDGTLHDLGTLGGSQAVASGINAGSQVVGTSDINGIGSRAFLHDGTTMHDLGTLGGYFSGATDINDAGAVVGWSQTAQNEQHVFLFDGALHDLGTLGGNSAMANAINEAGLIVGNSLIAGDQISRAFLYANGAMIDLGTLSGYIGSDARGINNAGTVVGTAYGDGGVRAFVHDGSGMFDLNTLLFGNTDGIVLEWASAINDKGQIVASGNGRTYLLTPVSPTPVPLPAGFWLFGSALAAMGTFARRTAR